MSRKIRYITALIGLFALGGCMPDFSPLEPPQADWGTARLQRLVAIGDRYTAGMIDGALGEFGQQFSYPALIARAAGIDTFQQPLIRYPGIGREVVSLRLIGRKLLLAYSPLTISSLAVQNTSPDNLLTSPPWDNFAVPQHKILDAVEKDADDGASGPVDVLTNLILQGNGSQVEQALERNPGMALVWLGLNDVLLAALSTEIREEENLTSAESFRSSLERVLAPLDSAGAQIVIATIPDVTFLPYLRHMPTVIINPTTGDTVRANRSDPTSWIGYQVMWSDSTVRTLSTDPDSPNFGLLSLDAAPFVKNGFGVSYELGGTNQPLPAHVVLDQDEITLIRSRIAAFNQSITEAAARYNAVLVDQHALFAGLFTEGYRVAGLHLTRDYITGGLFSLDAVHPTPAGYAIIANEFIRAINAAFGASLPYVAVIPQ